MDTLSTNQAPKVDGKAYLADLRKLVTRTEDDLRVRSGELADVHADLTSKYNEAVRTERTLDTFESWRDQYLTQVAVAWVLSCVFLRYLEDNALIDEVWLAGEGERLQRAHDRHQAFFQTAPTLTDRDYLLAAFGAVAKLPGCGDLFGEERNPLWLLGPSGDMAKEILLFFQAVDPASGKLLRTFGDPDAGRVAETRFLGDLYQDLSEAARKRYALLQTPDFVEEFILDRTLDPAIELFGIDEVRMLDPTCGSGHFLLGGFQRLLERRHKEKPAENERERVQRALDGVYGVDLNPFAVAIARFRLLVAALEASGIHSMRGAPNFKVHVAAGDSLLHGRRFGRGGQGLLSVDKEWLPDAFCKGDFDEATEILSQQYHAVVGNPPYIADKDAAHKEAVRQRYSSCHGKYVLAVPFKELFFDKTVKDVAAGYVGMITANNFMKREFGTKLIGDFFPTVDLTHVIDTSGAYIPGHGTPTVILFGRNRPPRTEHVRAALGIRGEPSTPDDPSIGRVWNSILQLIDHPGRENEYVTVLDAPRETFHNHPWSLSGGGAGDLKERIEAGAENLLGNVTASIGITAVTGEDDLYLFPTPADAQRLGISRIMTLRTGDQIRDWSVSSGYCAIWTYDSDFHVLPLESIPEAHRVLWPYRTGLSGRKRFGTPMLQKGATWYEWQELYPGKLRSPLSISFAEVATHNHFVLDRGGKVFNRSAPVIKLLAGSTVGDHLLLLGLLNSSLGCFWLKQVCGHKGSGSDKGNRQPNPAKFRYGFASTLISGFPLPKLSQHDREAIIQLSFELDRLATERASLVNAGLFQCALSNLRQAAKEAEQRYEQILRLQVALQEELDWRVYGVYGVISDPPCVELLQLDGKGCAVGARPFEILQARTGRDTGLDGQRLHSETDLVVDSALVDMWEARIRILARTPQLALVEDEVCKRRWSVTPKGLVGEVETFQDRLVNNLRSWLEDRIESAISFRTNLITSSQLTDHLRKDTDFTHVACVYTGRDDYNFQELVTDLLLGQDVPYLPVLRYKDSGLRKREQWERTWDLQRQEDAGQDVGKIPVPPKYGSGDFLKSHYWSLRGKLDVPKERFISYPHAERDNDPSPVIGWAGWNHAQQAQALAAYYIERKDEDGWTADRLTPLLAGLLELLPWLKQWHNEIDPEMDMGLGDFFEGFLEDQCRILHLTQADLRNWRPPAKAKGGGRKK